MRERPILFSAPMVRVLLDGSKMQTRRAFSTRMIDLMYVAAHAGEVSYFVDQGFMEPNDASYVVDFCPYGQPGDRLWVREAWAQRGAWRIPAWPDADADDAYWSGTKEVIYTADSEKPATGWRGRPSIHMPRWASRILLEIVSVRVERLQDINGRDADAEGAPRYACDGPHCPDGENGCNARGCAGAREWYEELWNEINGAGSWAANPWVWVVEFKRVTP